MIFSSFKSPFCIFRGGEGRGGEGEGEGRGGEGRGEGRGGEGRRGRGRGCFLDP